MNKQSNIAVIVLNWNGEDDTLQCIAALVNQSKAHDLVVVDNNSTDNLVKKIHQNYTDIKVIVNSKNLGFAGGVNTGIRYAIENKYEFVALINNDAKPEPNWLKMLVEESTKEKAGIITGKLLKTDGSIDSTGDLYTSWGLPFPRGRNEEDKGQFNSKQGVFAGTGGASLYRVKMLEDIGLFDENFFAYYEDVDLSFRAQLAGWKVLYTPKAVAYHKIGATSSKIPGFTTYMTIKNLPWLFWKNVPWNLMSTFLPKFTIAYISIVVSSLAKGKIVPVIKGLIISIVLLPKKLIERHRIQSKSNIDIGYLSSIITYDLPPNAHKLRKLRSIFK